MKHLRTPAMRKVTPRSPHGLTLIELMVAMLLGLLLAGAALSTFLASSQLARSMRGFAAVSDGGQTVTAYLARQIHAAGHLDLTETGGSEWSLIRDASLEASTGDNASLLALDFKNTMPGLVPIRACGGEFTNPRTLLDTTCASAANNAAHSLTVAYQVLSTPNGWPAASLPDTLNPNAGFQTDCGGRPTRATNPKAQPAGDVVINRYYLDTAQRRLMCIGNGDPTLPVQIASDIEQFRVLVATTQGAASGQSAISQFQPVTNGATPPINWASLRAVQVCVLAAGERGSLAGDSTSTNVFNVDCFGNPVSGADGRLRRAQTITINLRSGTTDAVALP
ncbi:MAG: hypothetical protein C4K60_08870 [Ideonella sp. MAG2]|nr:MAG: hypothetical protein C4K60_08870 [Ideonella sp. MAG2]